MCGSFLRHGVFVCHVLNDEIKRLHALQVIYSEVDCVTETLAVVFKCSLSWT